MEPLRYPPHYPPRTFWKKFFIGVRKLGPDLSFFPQLEELQRSRSESLLAAWGKEPRRLVVARRFSQLLHEELRWPNAVFLPSDDFGVIVGGPKFELVDDLGFETALQVMEKEFGLKVPFEFWRECLNQPFGEVVDAIVIKSQGT